MLSPARLSLVGCLLVVASSIGSTAARMVPHPGVLRRIQNAHIESRSALLDPTCQKIRQAISAASAVYAPGTLEYTAEMGHWCASSTQYAACSVEPGSVQDVATIMKIISDSQCEFAIRGGGHSCNPGFSSTTGIQITMKRMNAITVHSETQTVDLGPGLIWDDVFAKLTPLGISVVGGRVSGVGVPGFSLGGGLSWHTNLYGLTCDTIEAYELVVPSGQVLEVTASSHPDLFFGLKGGLNNFGVVTRFTLKSFPQTDVWGGSIYYDGLKWDELTPIIANWSASNTDRNANILPTYDVLAGVQILSILIFYNKPTPPAGLFDAFLAIPALESDVKTRPFSDMIISSPSNSTGGLRGAFSSVSLENLSLNILNTIKEEVIYYGTTALLGGGIFISYDVEPFMTSWVSHSTNMGPTAWPHSRFLSPLNLYFAWPTGLSDDIFHRALADTKAKIIAAAEAEGQNLRNLYTYPNYALATDSLESVYGPNVDELKKIAEKYDPRKVMTRTGGFIFQK